MKSIRTLTSIYLTLLLVVVGCDNGAQKDEKKSDSGQLSIRDTKDTADRMPKAPVKREGVLRIGRVKTGEVIMTLDDMVIGFGPDAYSTKYQYGNSLMDIPVGGETTPIGENNEPIGRAVQVVSGGELITEIEGGKKVHYLRLNDVLYCGEATSKRVLYYKPLGFDAKIHRLIADGRWETTFTYEGNPLIALPSLTTKDLKTGEIVYHAFDLKPIRTNVMQVNEEYYHDGKVVSKLVTERETGLGILIAVKSITAPIPQNYFAFDFVLNDWPFGNRGGFGGGFGGMR